MEEVLVRRNWKSINVELDERLTKLERDLKKQGKVRQEQRKRRQRNNVPRSHLWDTPTRVNPHFNTITHSKVIAEDQLFATLDPTSRRFRFPLDREIILTDTVGFIRIFPKN